MLFPQSPDAGPVLDRLASRGAVRRNRRHAKPVRVVITPTEDKTMSNRDHDPKLPEERLGTYTPGARLEPEPASADRRFDEAESRSWAAHAEDDARPQGFSGADVTPYGQLISGASDQVGGGFGGANVGGYGQQGLGSQWGQAGFGPLTQGLNYSAGGGRFGPAGLAPYPEGPAPRRARHEPEPRQRGGAFERPSPTPLFGSPKDAAAPRDFSGSAHDHHEPHFRHWRDAKLAAHDQDYARWREEQSRRYDEEYRTWRNAHHSAFAEAFDGWRDQRAASAGPSSAEPSSPTISDPNVVHGANPTLGDIADGGTGARHHKHDHEHDHERHADGERRDEVK